MTPHTFTAGFLFAGLGAGARGFLDAQARIGRLTARFCSVGGVDLDADACRDFERLTGSPALCADIDALQPHELRAVWGEASPDVVFLSAPCKGFSSLLSRKSAAQEKYQRLNQLALKGLWLLCETWPENPPGLLVFENVPRIATRGAELLAKIRQVLAQYGYRLHEESHDCGEIGGLAQHRRRYLMVARREQRVREFVYRPPLKRVRGVGEVLGALPLPGDPSAGPLHRMPRLKWVNWCRLALIRAGGDWRDLPKAGESIDLAASDEAFARLSMNAWPGKHPGKYGVLGWDQPARVVTGETDIQEGAQSVADPRIPVGISDPTRGGACGVTPWNEPAPTITGQVSASRSNTPGSVADPRIPLKQTADAADSYGGRPGLMGVNGWMAPLPPVTGTMAPTGSNAVASVADPRVALGCEPRSGAYGVLGMGDPSDAVTGSACIDNGRVALADDRIHVVGTNPRYLVMSLRVALDLLAQGWEPPKDAIPVIVAPDGTWHRPLTTLELAVLQGLPPVLDGKPLTLTASTEAKRREHVGNAVPVQAAQAIGTSLLQALLAHETGWFLAPDGETWVAPREIERRIPFALAALDSMGGA